MSSDNTIARPDVQFLPAGPGLVNTFRCPQCEQFRVMLGRRKQRVKRGSSKGLSALVCAVCVAEDAKEPA